METEHQLAQMAYIQRFNSGFPDVWVPIAKSRKILEEKLKYLQAKAKKTEQVVQTKKKRVQEYTEAISDREALNQRLKQEVERLKAAAQSSSSR